MKTYIGVMNEIYPEDQYEVESYLTNLIEQYENPVIVSIADSDTNFAIELGESLNIETLEYYCEENESYIGKAQEAIEYGVYSGDEYESFVSALDIFVRIGDNDEVNSILELVEEADVEVCIYEE